MTVFESQITLPLPSVVMWSLPGLLPLGLAAIVAGLPLRHSPEDTSRFELDRGIGGPRERSEAMARLYLQDHPATTGHEAALGHSHSGLRKRNITLDRIRRQARTGYRRLRNSIWSGISKERCFQRKVGVSQHSWQPIVCMVAEMDDHTQAAELFKESSSRFPTAATLDAWLDICSTWEKAHADTKDPYIGRSLTDGDLRDAAINRPSPSVEELLAALAVMRKLPGYSPLLDELERSLPDNVRAGFKLNSYLRKLERMKRRGRIPKGYNNDFTNVSPDLLKQPLKYFGIRGNAGMTPAGSRPMTGGGGVMRPI